MSPQVVVNAIVAASWYALIALGFSLCLRTNGFINIALAAVLALSGYIAFFLKTSLSLPLIIAVILGILTAAVLGGLMEVSIYAPMRRREARGLILLLSSLGLYVVLQNTLSLAFGDDVTLLRSVTVAEGLNVVGARITAVDAVSLVSAVAVLGSFGVFVRTTRMGCSLRAIGSDPQLAAVSGVDVDQVRILSSCIGSASVATAGILISLDTDLVPTMGLDPLLMGIVAAVIGGSRSPVGIVLGSAFLAVVQHVVLWRVEPRWHEGVAFMFLLVFLFVRPEGFLGKRFRTSTL